MNTFSKKSNFVLLVISIVALLLSSVLILLSNQIGDFIYKFLQEVVFKREFDFSKWSDTINSLIAFPIFIVVFVDALLFVKFNNKSKIILLSVFGFIITTLILYTALVSGYHSMDSDMASELLLAKECYLHKTFLPRSWNYSTEIRILNTQIFTAPLFIFTKNMNSIKAISALIICFLLPLSLYFLLSQLKIKTSWIKILSLILIFTPWSNSMWKYVQYGSYYIPHIAIAFCYIALFLAITYNKSDLSLLKYKILFYVFLALSFISGLSGIRYILYFVLPLTITILSLKISTLFKKNLAFNFHDFFITDKETHFSIVSLILSGIGYIFNTTVLSHFYSFSDFNTTAFTHIGDVTFTEVHNDIWEILGYKNNVSVFTPSGVNNVLLYVGIAFFIFALVKYLRNNDDSNRKTFVIFSTVLFIFNSFIFINTEYIARYFILLLAFVFPCIAIFLESNFISSINKYFIGLCFGIVVISNSFIVFEDSLCSNGNFNRKNVTEFLKECDYECGYATFWQANVINFLTNDKIQVANLYRYKKNGVERITDKFKCDKWLTPDSYYTDNFGNNKKVFLLVTNSEYMATPEENVFKNGKLVFNDSYYLVFEYEDNNSFKQSF